MELSFQRYLAAKKTVDDRSLNRPVWELMAEQLQHGISATPIRTDSVKILELGAGIGTMPERMLSWRLFQPFAYTTNIEYTAIDEQTENIQAAVGRLPGWAAGCENLNCTFEAIDLFDFIARVQGTPKSSRPTWDMLVAHAFLDLLDIPASLPEIFRLLKPDGLFYFTLNFDGVTLLEPAIDPAFDELVIELYHRTMDERIISGKRSGDSRAGRHLFENLRTAGAKIIEAGSSDWVVFPRQGNYYADEAYFLHFIIHFFETSLRGHPELAHSRFERWLAERHAQVERGELIYIAHQLDFVGKI